MSAQRALVRLVLQPKDGVALDVGGKAPGRGAYLCRRAACWQAGLRQKRLARALRTALSPQQGQALLVSLAAALPEAGA